MLDLLSNLGFGFLFATWAGFLLGVIWEWNEKVLFGLFVVAGLFVTVSTLVVGTSETATGVNWPFLIGTIPGYIVGTQVGREMYWQNFAETDTGWEA